MIIKENYQSVNTILILTITHDLSYVFSADDSQFGCSPSLIFSVSCELITAQEAKTIQFSSYNCDTYKMTLYQKTHKYTL